MSILGSDVGRALPELQSEAESLMTTACTLQRKDGHEINPANGQRIDTWGVLWEGPCRVTSRAESVDRVIGGQRVTFKPVTVAVPLGTVAQPGDRFVTEHGTFHVVDIVRKSLTPHQKYTCSEAQEVAAP